MSCAKTDDRKPLADITSPDQLHAWIMKKLKLSVPRRRVCPQHDAPFDYLCATFFEPAPDLVVWAPRGGGKTRLAALATLLDLYFKPTCAVRILGGSLEQSLRMWEHLLPDVETMEAGHTDGSITCRSRSLRLSSGSSAAVLTQSERAVRGLRVQKLRCDEVELFKPEIWSAAQLITKSKPGMRGSIEAISTYHRPFGMMRGIIDRAEAAGTRILRWCLLEVLERCPSERQCSVCPLWEDCQGIARNMCDGFFSVDDAISMKRRVSRETWDCEMLCKRPSVEGCVFPSFDPSIHARDDSPVTRGTVSLAMDFGFHNPFVCLWIVDDGSACCVVDEYIQPQRTIAEHIEQIEARPWGKVQRICCDPAGAGRNDQTSESNIQYLRRRGYRVLSRRSLIVEGLERIRAALRPAAGAATLFIHPRCPRLIAAMQQYRYAPDGGSELPVKDGVHDHLIDALRYFYVNRMTGTTPPARRY